MSRYDLSEIKSINYAEPTSSYKRKTKQIFDGLEIKTLGLVVAPSTSCKTTCAIQLAASASGYNVFSPVEPKGQFKTAFLSGEETDYQLRIRGGSINKYFNCDDFINLDVKSVLGKGFKITDSRFRDSLIEYADDKDCIFMDNLKCFHKLKENSNDDMNIVMDDFANIARQANCSIIIVHHASRPPKENPHEHLLSQYAARGATIITDSARWQLNLFKYKHCEKLFKSDHRTKPFMKSKSNLVGYTLPKNNHGEEKIEVNFLKTVSCHDSYVLTSLNEEKTIKNNNKGDINEKDVFK